MVNLNLYKGRGLNSVRVSKEPPPLDVETPISSKKSMVIGLLWAIPSFILAPSPDGVWCKMAAPSGVLP